MRKNKRQEMKQRLQRAHGSGNDKHKLARIIDSDEEDFEREDKWVQTKQELARQVHSLILTLAQKNSNG